MKNLSYIYIMSTAFVFLTGCTDVTPEVSSLNLPSKGIPSDKASRFTFAEATYAGVSTRSVASGGGSTYSASILVTDKNISAISNDGAYTLKLRKLSF